MIELRVLLSAYDNVQNYLGKSELYGPAILRLKLSHTRSQKPVESGTASGRSHKRHLRLSNRDICVVNAKDQWMETQCKKVNTIT